MELEVEPGVELGVCLFVDFVSDLALKVQSVQAISPNLTQDLSDPSKENFCQ